MEKMQRKQNLRQRIRSGNIKKQDVARRLAELAFGKANDCVRLVLGGDADLQSLDLSLLSEVKRSDKGGVEVKLIDRLQVLEQLSALTGEDGCALETLMDALQDGERT